MVAPDRTGAATRRLTLVRKRPSGRRIPLLPGSSEYKWAAAVGSGMVKILRSRP